jgi:hypothetical protein
MYVETVPNRGSPPAILLRESYRDGDRIRKRTLLNLSDWPSQRVEGLRALLKGGVVVPAGEAAFTVERSLPPMALSRRRWALRAPSVSTACWDRRTRTNPTGRAISSWR